MSVIASLLAQDTYVLVSLVVVLLSIYWWTRPTPQNYVPDQVPILGNAIPYGMDPIKFLQECQAKYGDVFTFGMLGRKMTFCLGPEGNNFVFNVPIAYASAEDAYQKLTTPVFGKGVVYDVPNAKFMEQKKFIKDALTTTAFKTHVPIIFNEVRSFFKEWEGKRDIFHDMSELTIRTASSCLMGKEIREALHKDVAKLYGDLDAGLTPIAVFFSWLPLPTYFARDRAHRIMTDKFKSIITKRTENNEVHNDLLQTLMNSYYKNGDKLSDDEVAHIMIATLMGGQHTSSTTSSWMLYELARRPDIIDKILEEQSMVLTGKKDTHPKDLPDFTYEQLRQFTYLDCCMKETLRLHSPIHTVMRKVLKPLEFKGVEIPAGHYLCGAASVSQMDPERFPNPTEFRPERFINNNEGAGEWTINGVDIAQKSAKSHFLPFGAGRHRCIGEAFGYLQIKTLVSLILREYKLKSLGFPKSDFTSLIVIPEKPFFMEIERRPF